MSNIRNRIHNSANPYQGKFKKVLICCSAGLLRSPTAALVLSQEPYSFNTRAAGVTKEFALIPVDEVLLAWADEVVCMTQEQGETIAELVKHREINVIVLNIEDSYAYRDPELVTLIKEKYDNAQKALKDAQEIQAVLAASSPSGKLDDDF
jgi:predicted protein tyrosine phosphatase